MIWGKTHAERYFETKAEFWWAWYPVRLEDGRWTWLQRVWWELRFYGNYYYAEQQQPPKKTATARNTSG